jgi:hypothetical protein
METLAETGAKFQSISEPWANTTTHAGKMIMTVFAGIAEFEPDLVRERTGAGRDAARKRGVQFGGPRKLTLTSLDSPPNFLIRVRGLGWVDQVVAALERTVRPDRQRVCIRLVRIGFSAVPVRNNSKWSIKRDALSLFPTKAVV